MGDVLGERLASQHDELLSPVPHRQHVVGIAGQRRQHSTVRTASTHQSSSPLLHSFTMCEGRRGLGGLGDGSPPVGSSDKAPVGGLGRKVTRI